MIIQHALITSSMHIIGLINEAKKVETTEYLQMHARKRKKNKT
jgi:hypothetical protein